MQFTFENLQWAVGIILSGYLPLAGAVGVMYYELIKSKNNEAETLRLVLPLIDKFVQIKDDLLEVIADLKKPEAH